MKSLTRLVAVVALAFAVFAASPTRADGCDRQPLRNLARAVARVVTAPARVVTANVAERREQRQARWASGADFPAVGSENRPECREVYVSDPPFPATVVTYPTNTVESCVGRNCPQPQRFLGYGRAVYPFK